MRPSHRFRHSRNGRCARRRGQRRLRSQGFCRVACRARVIAYPYRRGRDVVELEERSEKGGVTGVVRVPRRQLWSSVQGIRYGFSFLSLCAVVAFSGAASAEDLWARELTLNPKNVKKVGKGELPAAVARLVEAAGRPTQDLVFSTGAVKRAKAASDHEKVFELAPDGRVERRGRARGGWRRRAHNRL